jgi:hypothetical protein
MSELQEMCEGFERDQSEETKTEYRLPDRELLYNSYLKIQSDKLIGVVDNANKGAKQELENLEKRKTELVKSIFETFNLEFRPHSPFIPKSAFGTMRRLPQYGYDQGVEPDFEWSLFNDMN